MGNHIAREKCLTDGQAGVTIETTGHLTSWPQLWIWSRSSTYYAQLPPSSCCLTVNGYLCIFQLRNIFWHWDCQAWNKPHLYYFSLTLPKWPLPNCNCLQSLTLGESPLLLRSCASWPKRMLAIQWDKKNQFPTPSNIPWHFLIYCCRRSQHETGHGLTAVLLIKGK